MKVDHYLTPYTRINSKWTEDLKRLKTIKLEENTDMALFNISLSNIFLDRSPQARETSKNRQGYIKLKSFCTAKETIHKMKR